MRTLRGASTIKDGVKKTSPPQWGVVPTKFPIMRFVLGGAKVTLRFKSQPVNCDRLFLLVQSSKSPPKLIITSKRLFAAFLI
jgi:hypothetical protein